MGDIKCQFSNECKVDESVLNTKVGCLLMFLVTQSRSL